MKNVLTRLKIVFSDLYEVVQEDSLTHLGSSKYLLAQDNGRHLQGMHYKLRALPP